MTAARQSRSAPAISAGGPLDDRIDRLPVLEELDFTGLLSVGRQHPLAEIGKPSTIFHGHELPEPLVDHQAAIQAQQRGPGQVDLQNPPLVVPEEIGNWGKMEQVAVSLRRLLGRCLSPLEFLILHLQFDLMHLQLVDQARASASEPTEEGPTLPMRTCCSAFEATRPFEAIPNPHLPYRSSLHPNLRTPKLYSMSMITDPGGT